MSVAGTWNVVPSLRASAHLVELYGWKLWKHSTAAQDALPGMEVMGKGSCFRSLSESTIM